jgi:SAM-dependent methyltransferase
VVGVDMTEEQLSIAAGFRDYHAEKFGFDNVSLVHGYIESLDALGFAQGSFDIIVSNCVLNLSPDKAAVLEGVHRLLKPGGEFYFSDVYADRRLAEGVRLDPVLLAECLGGALYWNDFLRLAQASGFIDPRLVEDRPLEVRDQRLSALVAGTKFYSATYRLFKLAALESACEDYGQAVIYRGTVPDHPHELRFDKHHRFQAGIAAPVCGNSWRMLHDSRFRPHFEFIGDFNRHHGFFTGCGGSIPFGSQAATLQPANCC